MQSQSAQYYQGQPGLQPAHLSDQGAQPNQIPSVAYNPPTNDLQRHTLNRFPYHAPHQNFTDIPGSQPRQYQPNYLLAPRSQPQEYKTHAETTLGLSNRYSNSQLNYSSNHLPNHSTTTPAAFYQSHRPTPQGFSNYNHSRTANLGPNHGATSSVPMNESHHPTPQAFSDQNNPRAPNLRLETADSVSVPLPDLFQSSDLGSRNPPRSLPARLPTPNIDPAPVIPTSVEPDTAIKKAKYPLTPPDMMEMFAKKTLKELRDLQHTHIAYRRLNQAIKLEAQKLYFDYQHKQHLLSLKYRRPFRLLTKYLGQRRTRQKKTNWHKFQQTNPSAQDALHNTEVNIGQRNKQVSVIYKQSNLNASCGDVVESNVNTGDDPVSSKDNIFDKKPKSSAKIQAEIKAWAAGVQLKLKELSDLCGVEGFLVLAGQDHRKPFFFQGGSMHGDTFLRALIDEGDPMREFAIWTAGTKKVNKKRKATAKSPASFPSDGCIGQPVWKKLKVSAFENQDVCQGDLRSNQKYIATEFGKMYTEIQKNSTKKDTRGWPGTDTASRLAVFNHKLVVKENNIGLSAEHIENVPVKKINLETCWLILRGLKNNWIELVEHHFDVCRKKSSAPKRKGTKISATPHSDFFEDEFDNDHDNHGEDEEQGTDDEDGADHEEDEEDEDDEDDKDDEEDEEDEDDEDDDE